MILDALCEMTPSDTTADPSDPAVVELRAEGPTYEAAREVLFASVPDGHRVIWVRSR